MSCYVKIKRTTDKYKITAMRSDPLLWTDYVIIHPETENKYIFEICDSVEVNSRIENNEKIWDNLEINDMIYICLEESERHTDDELNSIIDTILTADKETLLNKYGIHNISMYDVDNNVHSW